MSESSCWSYEQNDVFMPHVPFLLPAVRGTSSTNQLLENHNSFQGLDLSCWVCFCDFSGKVIFSQKHGVGTERVEDVCSPNTLR